MAIRFEFKIFLQILVLTIKNEIKIQKGQNLKYRVQAKNYIPISKLKNILMIVEAKSQEVPLNLAKYCYIATL